MNLMVVFVVFALGLCLGSFINVVIYRLMEEKAITGRSRCPHCHTPLAWYDLIPLVSFVLLAGKCRSCQGPIWWQYPVVEAVTGVLFVLVFLRIFGLEFSFLPIDSRHLRMVVWWLFATLLFIIFVFDLKTMLIPDQVVFFLIAAAFLYELLPRLQMASSVFIDLQDPTNGLAKYLTQTEFLGQQLSVIFQPFLWTVLGSVGIAAFFLGLVIITGGRGMGGGDVKLGLGIGLVCAWPNMLLALFLAFGSGALVSVFLILTRKKSFGQVVPFAPFLTSGAFVALLYGDSLLDWYLNSIPGLS